MTKSTWLILFLLGMCFHCKSPKETMHNTERSTLLKGEYSVMGINKMEVSKINPNMKFDEKGNVSGFAGCNEFFGSYVQNESIVKISPLKTTKMRCMDNMQIEKEFLKIFNGKFLVTAQSNGFLLTNLTTKKTLFISSNNK